MTKRYIRLKEMTPNTQFEHVPAPDYISKVGPSLGAGPFLARTSSDGFLETGNTEINDSCQIVFLGDSFVESLYVPEMSRFPSIVERQLFDLGFPYACRNGGYSGSTTLNLFNVLINKIVPLVGVEDWVVFFVPQSDADSIMAPASYWNESKRSSTIIPGFKPAKGLALDGLAITRAILKMAVLSAKELGINIALAASPFRCSDYENDRILQNLYPDVQQFKQARAVREGLITTAIEVALESQVPFIDVQMRSEIDCFYDELHLNEVGQKLYADLLAKQLMQLVSKK